MQEYFCAKLIKEQPEELRAMIYEKKFAKRVESGDFGDDSFWNFCYEIDRIGFIKYFLLPKLINFKNCVFDDDDITQLRNYYSNVDLNGVHAYYSSTNHTISFRRRGSVYIFNLYSEIFRFLKIEGIRLISVKGWSSDSPEYQSYFGEMTKRFGDKEYSDYYGYNFIDNWCLEASDLMISLGFVEILNRIRQQVEERIDSFEHEIAKDNINTNTLLDI
jgi:hypothetical protein